MRESKIVILVCAVFWALLVLVMFVPLKIPFVDNTYSATRLLVTGQDVTGPEIRVLCGADKLKDAIPLPHPQDLNTNEIVMQGMSIYDWAEYPDYYMFDYVITGNFEELTTQYQETGSGTIPVFKTDTITPVGRISAWIEIKAGTLTILLICTLAWVLPITIICLCFLLYKTMNRTV